MFCNKCGNQLDDNAVFCAKCGNRVDGAPAPVQQRPVRPVTPKVVKPISAATLGYLRISSFALFVFGLILWFGGAPVGNYGTGATMPKPLTYCGGTFCTVLAVIFYSLGILSALLPFLSKAIGTSLPENVKTLICKKTYIQLLCAFVAFVFYIVGFSILLAKAGVALTFFGVFNLLLQLAHMGMLCYINTKVN